MRGHADLRNAVVAAAICALLALVLPFDVLRLLFAAPLTLFLPGYAITAAAFARRPLDRTRVLLLSLGLSLAVLALGGLVLDLLPGGIRAGSWALLLFVVVLGACRAAALARQPRSKRVPGIEWPRLSPGRGGAGLIAAGAMAAIAAIVIAFLPFSAGDAVGYSEMWIQPAGSDGVAAVEIGVSNRMQRSDSYRLRVLFGEDEAETVKRSFTLEPGEEELLRLPATTVPSSGGPLPVVAILYRENKPKKPYRRVTSWIAAPESTG